MSFSHQYIMPFIAHTYVSYLNKTYANYPLNVLVIKTFVGVYTIKVVQL